ncbi:unnamed protein product [Amoebophrya sp. A120]|nr:unnamed protein product [Amoebophrya sp. A120]|eukprot:GSA120T00016638001.1
MPAEDGLIGGWPVRLDFDFQGCRSVNFGKHSLELTRFEEDPVSFSSQAPVYEDEDWICKHQKLGGALALATDYLWECTRKPPLHVAEGEAASSFEQKRAAGVSYDEFKPDDPLDNLILTNALSQKALSNAMQNGKKGVGSAFTELVGNKDHSAAGSPQSSQEGNNKRPHNETAFAVEDPNAVDHQAAAEQAGPHPVPGRTVQDVLPLIKLKQMKFRGPNFLNNGESNYHELVPGHGACARLHVEDRYCERRGVEVFKRLCTRSDGSMDAAGEGTCSYVALKKAMRFEAQSQEAHGCILDESLPEGEPTAVMVKTGTRWKLDEEEVAERVNNLQPIATAGVGAGASKTGYKSIGTQARREAAEAAARANEEEVRELRIVRGPRIIAGYRDKSMFNWNRRQWESQPLYFRTRDGARKLVLTVGDRPRNQVAEINRVVENLEENTASANRNDVNFVCVPDKSFIGRKSDDASSGRTTTTPVGGHDPVDASLSHTPKQALPALPFMTAGENSALRVFKAQATKLFL